MSAFLAACVLSLGITGCASNSDEANLPVVQMACLTVTSAYEGWIIAGGSTESGTGSVGRRGTMTAIDAGLAALSEIVSTSELESARDATVSKEHSFTAAEVAVGFTNFRNIITNWENLNSSPWTAGEMKTIDTVYYNAVRDRCASLAGTDSAVEQEKSLGLRDEVEANAKIYTDLDSLIEAYEQAGGDCSKMTVENDGTRDYQASCSDEMETSFSSLWLWESDHYYENSRPEQLWEIYWEVYGPNWSVSIPKISGVDPEQVAQVMGGIFFTG